MNLGGTAPPDGAVSKGVPIVGRPRLVLADDHPEIIEELQVLLGTEFEISRCASDGGELLQAFDELHPDVVITDVYMPGVDGIEASTRILRRTPNAAVVVLSMHHEPGLVARALAGGVRGYVLKLDAGEELGPAIRAVLKGETYLSRSIARL